jgi:hypothetical protein
MLAGLLAVKSANRMYYLKITKVAFSVLVTAQEGKEGKPIISSSDHMIIRKYSKLKIQVSIAVCTLTVHIARGPPLE